MTKLANIVVPEIPDPEIRSALLNWLIAYNESKTGPLALTPVAVILEDASSGQMVGGLWGRTIYDWLFVEFLFVPENLRGQGHGKLLLQRAEEEALARGCVGVWLDSFDFQAPGFYQKLGYRVVTTVESPQRGFKRNFLRKDLIPK